MLGSSSASRAHNLPESKREQRGTMAHEERDEDVHAWQPRTTRSRGERERARRRGFRGHRHG